ncbi:MAG: methyltransferase domain-containing protein [Bacteroidota bacterium]
MFSSFNQRSDAVEIIDDFSMSGQEVIDCFKTIERVNKWLGGNKILVKGVATVLQQMKKSAQVLRITDLGSGSGDGLIALAKWVRKEHKKVQIEGWEANEFILAYAEEQAQGFPEISYRNGDILADSSSFEGTDVITLNLCLHHFEDHEIEKLINKCINDGARAILVNDLHRHWLAYFLFTIFCRLTFANRVARIDGLISIQKGFTRKELMHLAQLKGVSSYQLKWKWAFRYQLILWINKN